ncbi:type III restriction protein res subunit, partial [Gracilibacillus halophilus YIM-C55.5]
MAFINFSGLQLLLDPLKQANKKGIKGKIITSTYLNFTEHQGVSRIL